MMAERLVIIGGVAAGAKAAAKARRMRPDLDIVVYQDETEVSYSACGQPYVLSGVIENRDKIVIRRPQEFASDNIRALTRHRVEAIDVATRQIRVNDLSVNGAQTTAYDKLILATGARPIIPAVDGIELEGVLTLRSISDLDRFKSTIDILKPGKAAIIGAGYIGLELAETFHELNVKTTIIEKFDRILPKFDEEMAQQVSAHLVENNVELITGQGLAGITGENGRVVSVTTESGLERDVDLVVVAIGVRPNTDLAKDGGIAIGETGAIAVDRKMQTRVPGVYAAGDCCETVDRVTGKTTWLPLGDIANLQGRIAGENAAGGDASFPGVLGTAIFKTFDLNVACTGLSETAARQAGYEAVSVNVNRSDRARYYPGGNSLAIKLVADKQGGRLLGAQVIGPGKADKMIDIAATALLGRLTCEDLENADLAYAPPFSPVLSPMITAAGALNSKVGNR
ncbi:MAG: FAD-dependent oxidoreductase [Gammaproteobacteria bacterium]|nr:FAD-dependent oxidoreductase [Gammaproteobacteria bacterium]